MAGDDDRGAILAFVHEHPGEWGWVVVSRGRGSLSRRQAGRLVRAMLREQAPPLSTDRLPGQDVFQARLYPR